jgi:hypothetical protein
LILLRLKKAGKSKVQLDPLERVKEVLSPKKARTEQELIKRVKGILKSKGIKYRISHKEVDESCYQKNQAILLPEYKLIFTFLKKEKEAAVLSPGWTIEQLQHKPKYEAIDYVVQIISRVEELVENGRKQAQV